MSRPAQYGQADEGLPDIEAAVRAEMARGIEVDAMITGTLAAIRDCPDAVQAVEKLEYLAFESVDRNDRLQRLAIALEDAAKRAEAAEYLIEFGRQMEREAAARTAAAAKHRKPGSGSRQGRVMRVINGGVAAFTPAAVLAALGRTGHAHLAGHHALAVKVTAASLVLSGSGLAVGAAVVIGHAQSQHAARVHAVTAAGSTPPDMAVRIPLGQQKLIAALTRPRPRLRHGTAGVPAASSLLPLLPPPAVTVTAGPSQPAQGQPSPSASQGPQAGVLSIPVTSVQADPATGASIVLDASADGAVPWGMTCTAAAGSASLCSAVAFSATHGAVPAGGSEEVDLSFSPAAQAAGGDIILRFAAPGKRIDVTVTWLPVPQPAVTATPAGTGTPSPDPSLPVPVAS